MSYIIILLISLITCMLLQFIVARKKESYMLKATGRRPKENCCRTCCNFYTQCRTEIKHDIHDHCRRLYSACQKACQGSDY